jgi:RimJ/RimL family protein N-acetyltransferase
MDRMESLEFMVQSTLRTEHLRLVALDDEHLRDEFELDSDPRVMRYIGRLRTWSGVTSDFSASFLLDGRQMSFARHSHARARRCSPPI